MITTVVNVPLFENSFGRIRNELLFGSIEIRLRCKETWFLETRKIEWVLPSLASRLSRSTSPRFNVRERSIIWNIAFDLRFFDNLLLIERPIVLSVIFFCFFYLKFQKCINILVLVRVWLFSLLNWIVILWKYLLNEMFDQVCMSYFHISWINLFCEINFC